MFWFVLAIFAAFFGALYFFEMKTLIPSMNPNLASGVVLSASGLMLFIFSAFNGIPETGADFLPALFLAAFLNALAAFLYLRALKMTDLSLAMPITAFTPIFLILVSPLILGEFAGSGGIAGIVLIVIGSYVLNVDHHERLLSPFRELYRNKGMLCMLGVSFIFSVSANFNKMVFLNSDAFFGPALVWTLTGAAMLFMFFFKSGKTPKNLKTRWRSILLATFASAASTILVNFAWSMEIVPYVTSVYRTGVVFSVLLGGIFLHEKRLPQHLIAAVLMVFGVAMVIIASG
ncbi:EamA family transporter [Candidatus Micrarchaeota archaeon]|nr:EamA family transporter [Candidatus Micrarchaeota archaeon]